MISIPRVLYEIDLVPVHLEVDLQQIHDRHN